MPEAPSKSSGLRVPHAVVMMLLIIVGAVAFTYVVPSGAYHREHGVVVPGTYHQIPKDYALRAILAGRASSEQAAYPASPVAVFTSIPAGMQSTAALIFMILFIGGMFGVLQETGALNAGIERLLARTRGNVYLLAPLLMIAISAGSTFLGLISEYLVIIPLMVVLAERLGLDALFGTAVVAIAAKIGYMTSVTNPLPLVIAQPIVGLPVFSGAGFRLVTWIVYLAVGIGFLLLYVRRNGYRTDRAPHGSAAPLSGRHLTVMLLLIAAIGVIVYGAGELRWGNLELGAFYIFVAFAIAVTGRLPAGAAATAFLNGVRAMVLAALLVGLARAVELILRDGLVLDTIIYALSRAAHGRHPAIVAQVMVLIQMAIDILIPSTSGQAAVTMPILGPIGHLAGVSPQVSVSAFIFGNGLSNTITPTSGMLLAYLATGKVAYGTWVRFVYPLVLILAALSLVAITVAALVGL
jgi:uncharacterized ion transporter superfamily protein YfcC